MSTKIKPEAIIRALDTPRSSLSCHSCPPWNPPLPADGLFSPSDAVSPSPVPYVGAVPKTKEEDYCPELLPLDSDEDCISLGSCGSASFCGRRSADRRVSFAATLVTEVRTRPRTRDCYKKLLFYTHAETDR